MENPNPYVDDSYARSVGSLNSAIDALWTAGASIKDISREIENAIENATEHPVLVEIERAP